ncbi:MAG TPA: GNAT family N-acetyltransferase [Actinocrinis sp.]|nr:GNAT family N-acetyltransferase [Actinocrinis sp.]
MDVIRTDRLRLRPLSTADVDAWVVLHADERVGRFIGSYTPELALARLEAVERQWAERGHGLFAFEDAATGELIGRGGLQYWEPFDEVEAAWTLRSESWGKGYAAEAARAFVDWGWGRLDVPYITAMIHPGNDSSVRLAERLGFTARRQDELMGKQITVYSLDRPV